MVNDPVMPAARYPKGSTRPARRHIHGVLLLDKPLGISSNQALQAAKRLLGAKKAGHTGSLDPLATGMLPLCFGHGTKICAYLLESDKVYRFSLRLGDRTSTGDTDGEVIETLPVPPLTEELVEQVIDSFRGEIQQVPPMYSALKKDGRRLYELAREGKEVDRAPRRCLIHELTLLDMDEQTLTFDVRCSKGTYIRSLAEDIARALDTCGHVRVLRRLAVDPFPPGNMVTLEQLEAMVHDGDSPEDLLLPVDSGLEHFPAVQIAEQHRPALLNGNPVAAASTAEAGLVRVYAGSDFLAIGEKTLDGMVAPKRLFALP